MKVLFALIAVAIVGSACTKKEEAPVAAPAEQTAPAIDATADTMTTTTL